MPRIDPLLTALVSNKADSIQLAEGDIAHLIKAGTRHPLTRQPLGDGQLLILLREMASEDVAHALGGVDPIEFVYANGEGRFVARVIRENGSLKAVVSPEPAHGNGSHKEVAAPVALPPSVQPVAQQPAQPAAAPASAPVQAPASAPAQAPAMPSPAAAAAPIRPPVDPAARAEIDALLKQLVAEGGSDLHLRVGEPPLIRLHGELKRLENRPKLETAITEAMLNAIMPDRNYIEFRDTNDSDFAYEIEDVARYRANAFRDHHGAGGVFRVIPSKVATVEDLGITPEVQKLCFLTKGLVLVTGPTGSGKSTTLGGLIDLVNRSRNDHVITIEDPIEFVHKNKKCVITQRQVGLHTGSFKHALRAALREDPDVVLIGELRDLETISIAIETAETGHLVFGTLHTTTAVGTIDRVIDQFPADRQEQIRVMLADSLKGVISQTLCKKIGGGRVAAREILLTIPAVSNLIREGKAFQIPSVMQTSRKLGMIQLGDVLIDLVDKGLVEPQEAYMKCTDKASFMVMLKTRGHELNLSS